MRRVLPWVIPALLIYLFHSLILGGWIVDDAGISFAYARNLAHGHGLVSQPGAEPVEGFTNLLWVLILAGTMLLRVFDPVITPKIIAGLCVLAMFVLTARAMGAGRDRPGWLIACALAMSAGLTGFSVWCASGLENALYALCVAGLAVVVGGNPSNERDRMRQSVLAGVVLFLVFIARPDGALYFWLPPFFLGLGTAHWRRPLRAYSLAFIGPWALLTILRAVYFRDLMPNTFYAKQGEGAIFFAWLIDTLPLAWATVVTVVLGSLVIGLVALGCAALGRWVARRVSPATLRPHVLALFFVTSILVYFALRGDWMGEFRFATPAFLLGPAAVLGLLHDGTVRSGTRGRAAVVVVTVLLMAGVARYSWRHTAAFAAAPTISLQGVRATATRIADVLGPLGAEARVLTPDIGGALWEDRFVVDDLVGLVDRRIARRDLRDRERLRDYLLHERRSDAVYLHSVWLAVFSYGEDAEFRSMYVPVWEERAAPNGPLDSGFYIRRDLVATAAVPGPPP